jgi:hypothetical protein
MVVVVPAYAQQGVFIDPGSPSGKEYALRLETARRAADPGRDPSAPVRLGETSAPLFGQGIRSAERGGAKRRVEGFGGGRTELVHSPAAVRIAAAHPGTPTGGTSAVLVVSAASGLILLAGALAGVALRRRKQGR